MLQAMAKKITWWQAAEILGISDRHSYGGGGKRYVEEGYNGFAGPAASTPSRPAGAGGDGGESVRLVPGGSISI